MKGFIQTLKIAFAIIGTVIGAGFLSGKEIYEFFVGTDIILSCGIMFIVFFIILIFLLKNDLSKKSRFYNITLMFILIGNYIIMFGMLSAVDSLFSIFFPQISKFSIFSVLTIIISNIIMFGGTSRLKNVNFFIVPLIIIIIIFILYIPHGKVVICTGKIKPSEIFSYSGLNLMLAIPVIIKLGKGEKVNICIFAALIASLCLSILVYMIFTVLCGSDKSVLQADMPAWEIFKNNDFLYFFYALILYAGILTTLFSAHYPLFNFFPDTILGSLGKIILSVSAVLLAKIGFNKIISHIYPVTGAIGFILIVIFFVEAIFFPKRQQSDT